MPMSPRLLRPRASGDPDAGRYIAAVQAADGQALEPAVRQAIEAFVRGCKSDGIWPAIKASCILMGARTLSGALTPLVGTAPTNNNFVSGDYNRKTGLVGNGTSKFLDTNRANNADGQDNQSYGVYVSSIGSVTNNALIGTGTGLSSGSSHIVTQQPPASPEPRVAVRSRGNSATITVVNQSLAGGFYGASRASSANFSYRFAGISGSSADVSIAPEVNNMRVFARGSGAELFSGSRIAFYWVGESLTLSSLDSRVTTLYAAIGAAVP